MVCQKWFLHDCLKANVSIQSISDWVADTKRVLWVSPLQVLSTLAAVHWRAETAASSRRVSPTATPTGPTAPGSSLGRKAVASSSSSCPSPSKRNMTFCPCTTDTRTRPTSGPGRPTHHFNTLVEERMCCAALWCVINKYHKTLPN